MIDRRRDFGGRANEIIPGLWQGDQSSGVMAAEREFDVVVNLTPNTMGTQGAMKAGATYHRWAIEDGPLPDMEELQRLVDGCAMALRVRRSVLVHCAAGINRSGLLCALVVREVERCTGAQAIEIVRHARPGALSNTVFAAHLASLPAPE